MIDGTFVTAIAEHAGEHDPIQVDEHGREFVHTHWTERKRERNTHGAYRVWTLDSIGEYLKENRDRLTLEDLTVHVVSPTKVSVFGPLEQETVAGFRRREYLFAESEPVAFEFGTFMLAEMFVIRLQTMFEPTGEVDAVLKLVGSIKDSKVMTADDDGVTQQVTAAKGVSLVRTEGVKNPWLLAPYRTFREIAQPESPFVLRLKSGEQGELPKIALFEADGGSWKLDAVKRVRDYLADKVDGKVAVIA